MIPIGPVAAQRKSNGDALLVVAIATSPVRCLCVRAEDGMLEWVDREETVFTGWSFEPDAGIWVSEGEALYQAAEQEEVSGEALD